MSVNKSTTPDMADSTSNRAEHCNPNGFYILKIENKHETRIHNIVDGPFGSREEAQKRYEELGLFVQMHIWHDLRTRKT
jgi:hypothetical protein